MSAEQGCWGIWLRPRGGARVSDEGAREEDTARARPRGREGLEGAGGLRSSPKAVRATEAGSTGAGGSGLGHKLLPPEGLEQELPRALPTSARSTSLWRPRTSWRWPAALAAHRGTLFLLPGASASCPSSAGPAGRGKGAQPPQEGAQELLPCSVLGVPSCGWSASLGTPPCPCHYRAYPLGPLTHGQTRAMPAEPPRLFQTAA